MIDLNTTNEWQHRCPETGLVLPWYTKSFLDELVTWDLKDKVVFEYGCGASSLWWAAIGCVCYGVESNYDYFFELSATQYPRLTFAESEDEYADAIFEWGKIFDVIIVDAEPVEWRDSCVKLAINHLRPGGCLIIDNWDQPSVWVPNNETRNLLSNWPVAIYKQEGHPDWQTAVFTKPKEIVSLKITECSRLENDQYGIAYTYKHTGQNK